MKICAFLALLISGLYLQPVQADSMRCYTSLVQTGATKADVLDRCGEPAFTDSYCEPITIIGQANTTIIVPCEEVDLWTYHPGAGRFVQHLYFKRGKLQSIKKGRRM